MENVSSTLESKALQFEQNASRFFKRHSFSIRIVFYISLTLFCLSMFFVSPTTALCIAVDLVVFSSVMYLFESIAKLKTK